MESHRSKTTRAEHMETFYKTFPEVKDEYFDGMIITGAPIEHLPFEEVDYWEEFTQAKTGDCVRSVVWNPQAI